MSLLDVSHPPAGATTLIVSLGIIARPRELVVIEVAVFLLVAQALLINRLAGLPYPFWKAAVVSQIDFGAAFIVATQLPTGGDMARGHLDIPLTPELSAIRK